MALIPAKDGQSLAGVLMIDVRTGRFRFVEAKAVLLATGGGPTMYRYHTPSGDKSMDGLAMALRLGLPLRDMEMVQFHPTGLLAGPDTRMTGTVLEEGLRGAGGHLLNGAQRALHGATTTRKLERATRDFVSRAIYAEMRAGRTTPQRRRLHQDGPPRAREGRASSSRAWWSAAPTAASIWPAAWWRWCRRRTTSWAGWCARSTPRPSCPACSWPARTPAACTAPTGSAATASPTPPCSAASPARRWPAWIAANPGHRAPDEDVIGAEMARAQHPFARKGGDLNRLRETPARRHVGRRRRDPRRGRPAARPGEARRHRGRAARRPAWPTATAPST